jgi:hypothetical protein
MISAKDNPPQNKLNPGITDKDVESAIIKSGYPLQTIIANKLRNSFYCQEEWSFIDNKTKEIRSLDIMAQMSLYDLKDEPRVRPTLNLLIECKQSELPYVFFILPDKLRTPYYPLISGLFQKNITISTDDDPSTWTLPIIHVLGLEEDGFLVDSAPNSMTFSKCTRSGKEIVLSGTESYQGLVLPLIKSLQHFDKAETPVKTAYYFDAHLVFLVGIIDGPMIGVTVGETSHKSEFLPWIRAFRHESYEHNDWSERRKLFAIDLIHKDYFDTFINEHLLPFANKYAKLIIKHGDKIADGKAFAKGMGKDSWTNIELRLEEHSLTKKRILPKLKRT